MSGSKVGFNFQTVNKFNHAREQTLSTKTVSHQTAPQQGEYIVKRGDTLTEIAIKTGQNLQQLLQRNQQIRNPNKIQIGQHINIGKPSNVYTVKSGDTISKIAETKHTTVSDIMRANPGEIGNRNLIYPGQKLIIPKGVNQSAPTARKTPQTDKPKQPVSQKSIGTTPSQAENKSKIEQPKINNQPQKVLTSGNLKTAQINLDDFLSPEKGSDAGYSILIGNAEGNRYPDGRKTQNYYGHPDPGDGKWNIGSFSYSNERGGAKQAKSPEDADRIQLSRLYKNKDVYAASMNKAGLDPNNALLATVYFDMYNQSPTSAELLLKPENLKYLKENGITIDTMKEWRYRGFINPETGKQRINGRGKLAGGSLVGGDLHDGYAGLANRTALNKYKRAATEDELKALIRRDQNRRVDAMIIPLKNVGLLKIDTQKELPNQISQPSQNVETPQKTNRVVFEKANGGAIDTVLPASGKGYVTYKNDGNDHYGTAQTVKALQTISAQWNEKHAELKLQIGDMSRKGGGHLAPHGSHRTGIDADVRPFRKDGKLTGLNAVAEPQNFDREKTREFINLVKQLYPNTVILFNDRQLIKEGLTKQWEGHDDHLHVRFK